MKIFVVDYVFNNNAKSMLVQGNDIKEAKKKAFEIISEKYFTIGIKEVISNHNNPTSELKC